MPNFWRTGAPRIFKIQWFPLSILIFWSKILLFRTHHLYNSTTELILMSTLELYQPKPAQVSNYFFLKRVHHRTFLERLSLEISVRPNIMGWNPIRSKYTLFENDSITDINYPELLTAFYHYIIYMHIKKAYKN